MKTAENETPQVGYKPKVILPYTQAELDHMGQCDCDAETMKWRITLKQIRLDAYKAGMRRAARINRSNMDKWRLTKEDAGYGAEVSALDILTAAEQLTTKDL